jgi:ABC-type lipoprotein export system ATPase subunit
MGLQQKYRESTRRLSMPGELQWSATASPQRVASDDQLVQSQRERHDVSELIAAETGPQDRIGPECALHGVGDNGLRAKPVLQLKGVGKSYRRGDEQVQVLVDFDFIVEAGEFVVVTGPSGAGKTTLLHIAGGLDAPDTGAVAVNGQDVWSMSAGARAAFRRRNLGFVFQFFNLVPMLTAVQNVSLPLVLDGMPARSADARADELLQRVGLGDRARHRPAELSGGQMQRVAVARALVARPSIIIADEPTGNLDSHSSTEVLELLRSLSDEDGAAVVMVTHDQAAASYGSRELQLVDGHAYEGNSALPVAER